MIYISFFDFRTYKYNMSVFRNGLFAGKVAIVTGGGTGIGKAITTELLTLGRYEIYIFFHFFYCNFSFHVIM